MFIIYVYCRILSGILPRCIAFLIGSQQIENASNMKRLLKKLHTLKQLISKFYNYIYIKETINDFVKDLMTALKSKHIFFRIMFQQIILINANYILSS